jgi:hypothetical protein
VIPFGHGRLSRTPFEGRGCSSRDAGPAAGHEKTATSPTSPAYAGLTAVSSVKLDELPATASIDKRPK